MTTPTVGDKPALKSGTVWGAVMAYAAFVLPEAAALLRDPEVIDGAADALEAAGEGDIGKVLVATGALVTVLRMRLAVGRRNH